jgi:CubicO group peptidase (beta-lactamase class C family)
MAFRLCRSKIRSHSLFPKMKATSRFDSAFKLARNLLVISAILLVSANVSAAQDVTSNISDYMHAQVEVNHFSGSMLLARHGKILAKARYGSAAGSSIGPDEVESRYPVGSIAKQFIAAAILQLQEKNKLRLQDSVCKYIAKCPNGWQEIKIFNLLVQSDGILEVSASLDAQKIKATNTTSGLLAYLADRPLEFKPGEKFRYGNSGYAVLGAVIEKVSGEPYLEYLKKHIFGPLGMCETGYDDARKIAPIDLGKFTSITPSDLESTIPYSWGRLYSTVDDIYRWDRALNGEELLSKNSVNAMFTPYIDGYGFGWVVSMEFERILDTTAGGIYLFESAIRRYAPDDVCVVVLSNSVNSDAGKISRDLAAILFKKHYELPAEHQVVSLSPATLNTYVGRYELSSGLVLVVSEDEKGLMIQRSDESKIEIFPESETRFFVKGSDAMITFVTGPQGSATRLVLQQGGRDIPAPRIN